MRGNVLTGKSLGHTLAGGTPMLYVIMDRVGIESHHLSLTGMQHSYCTHIII